MTPALRRVRAFAVWAHGDQYYGGGLFPYVKHLDDVVGVLQALKASDTLLTAGYLHDVVEDTDVSIAVVEELFGDDVAKLVAAVTNEFGSNRAARHERTYPKIRAAGRDAVLLKVADRIANVSACMIPGPPPDMLPVYMKEHPGFVQALHMAGEIDHAWKLLAVTFSHVKP